LRRDGLNRIPLEFVLAKQRANVLSDGPDAKLKGVVIVSEFISVARVMRGAVIVNPWKIDEVSAAIKTALEMELSDQHERAQRNLGFALSQTTTTWALQVLQDLKSVVKLDNEESVLMGFGLGFRVLNVREGFNELSNDAVCKAYRDSRCRLILLDWGGTLVAEGDTVDKLLAYSVAKRQASRSGLTGELSDTLINLCHDPQNVVFVVSGKQMYSIDDVFGEFPNLGLGAEHGFYYRWPKSMLNMVASNTPGNRDSIDSVASAAFLHERESHSSGAGVGGLDENVDNWHSIHALGDMSWKKTVERIMELYCQRTHGTYIESKGSALIWQFRDADPEFGYMQSKELEEHLKMSTAGFNLEIIRGGGVSDGYIEVRPAGVSKGLFVRHIVKQLKKMHRHVDFILAIGDDISDEPMFEFVNQFAATTPGAAQSLTASVGRFSLDSKIAPALQQAAQQELTRTTSGYGGQGLGPQLNFSPTHASTVPLGQRTSFFSVTVGKKSSVARSYVNDPNAVRDLLQMLVRQTQYLFRQSSHGDFLAKPLPHVSIFGCLFRQDFTDIYFSS
jgi:trehalose 6-phosphate synthase/phosphatase